MIKNQKLTNSLSGKLSNDIIYRRGQFYLGPKNLSKFIVKKGSIAMDGISLTVVDVKNNLASICLIPHTIEVTNFKTKKIGDKVNIETDILGKYILK